MNPAEERALELALREELGGEPVPDVCARVLARADAETGPLRTIRRIAAVAAVVLAGAVLWQLLDRGAPPEDERALSADLETRIAALLADLHVLPEDRQRGTAEGRAVLKRGQRAVRTLADLVREEPRAWSRVRSGLVPLPEDPARAEVRARCLETLARGPDPGHEPVLLATLHEDAPGLADDVLLLLAERGVPEAHAALGRRLAASDVVLEQIFLAAYFAYRGDTRGDAVLRWFLYESGLARRSPSRLLASASGLALCGEQEAWRDALRLVREEVERLLSTGQPSYPRMLVAYAAYFDDAVQSGRAVPLHDLAERLERREEIESETLATDAQIRARLAEIEARAP